MATFNLNAGASTNATSVKGTAAELYTITAFNAGAALAYLKIYNKASAPTVGTDAPFMVVALPATSTVHLTFRKELRLINGLALATTTGAADTDATAIAAAQIKAAVVYR